MWFNIDFYKYVLVMLPTFLRKQKMVLYLIYLILPVAILHNDFLRNRKNNLKKLTYNGQVCYLRAALNDKYDRTFRRIVIVDVPKKLNDFIYTKQENRDVYLGTMFIEQDFVYNPIDVDFLVKVPSDVLIDYENYIKSTVDLYLSAGKNYRIVEL